MSEHWKRRKKPGPHRGQRTTPSGTDGPARRAHPGVGVIHREPGIAIVEKPAGMPVHAQGRADVLAGAAVALGRGRDPRRRPIFVTDLDRDASGLVVLAASARDREQIEKAVNPTRGERVWLAVVAGAVRFGAASDDPVEMRTIQTHVRRNARGVGESVPGGEPVGDAVRAVSHVRVLARGNDLTLVQVRAETDVPWQVRAHLAELGHPIVGDRAYGSTRDDLGRLGLHLGEIAFKHVKTRRFERYRTRPPGAFWEAVGASPPAHADGARDARGRDAARGWEHVAEWYDDLLEQRRSDLHDTVVVPGVLRLLAVEPGERVLDVACGQGALCRAILEAAPGATLVGVDASARLVSAARERTPAGARFEEGDARGLGALELGVFDKAACVLAAMNIDPFEPVCAGVAASLKPGGRFVLVVLHPAFRVPRASRWGWVTDDGGPVQFRRVDRYLSAQATEIVMNPGEVAHGAEPVTTVTHHRPLSELVRHLTNAGLLIEAVEEWTSPRQSEPGPRAEAENRARREIPMFLAIAARRVG